MNDKNRESNKSWLLVIISALVSVLFCATVWAIIRIYPGSYRTLLNSDMESQYVAFFESLRSIVNGENSIFYNWSLYLGSNYLGHYAYYLASPWSWFLLLWKTEDLPIAIYFMSLIKVGLCGGFFSLFLVKRPINSFVKSTNNKAYAVAVVMFSMCYALMSYNMIYIICPMWIDTVYMLPLVILGLERIIAYRKGGVYYLSFALTIIFNFYTAFMVAIFTVIYCVYYFLYYKTYISINANTCEENNYILPKAKDVYKTLLLYIVNSFLAAGTACVLLLPTAYCLMQGKMGDDTRHFFKWYTFPIWEILLRFFNPSYTTIDNTGLPNVFCSSFCILFTIFFIVRGLKKSSKVSAICISVFWVLSLLIVPLNRIWTGFRDPIWFPFRYSFVISFFFVLLGFEGFITFVDLKINLKFNLKRYIYVLWFVLTVFEMYLCVNYQRVGIIRDIGPATLTQWNIVFDNYQPMIKIAKAQEENSGSTNGFYRIDKNEFLTFNEPMLLDYHGVQSFSSVFNEKPLYFLRDIGLKQDDYELYELGSTVISDSIIGVKYYMQSSEIDEFYNEIAATDQMRLFENPYAMSLGYMIDGTAYDFSKTENVFDNLNALLSTETGKEVKAYDSIEFEMNDLTYSEVNSLIAPDAFKTEELEFAEVRNKKLDFVAAKDGHVYIYGLFDKGNYNNTTLVYNKAKMVYLNSHFHEVFVFGGYTYLMDLGVFKAGDEIEVIVTNCSENTKFFIAQMDVDVVRECLEDMGNNSQMKNININKGNLTAEIDVDKAGIMFTSIPYDKGWTLYIDGKEKEIKEIYNTFCSVELEPGHHTIEMKYVSPLFKEGLIVTVASIVVFIGGALLVNSKRKKNKAA